MIDYVIHGCVRSYAEVPRGAKVTAVNGLDVAGQCEGCGRYIFYESDYFLWDDGVYTCAKCGGPEEDDA